MGEQEGGAGVARAVGIFWPGVARTWRGHGAAVPPGTGVETALLSGVFDPVYSPG
eukprot:gene11927-biopygen4894